jgi:hypothetical protein
MESKGDTMTQQGLMAYALLKLELGGCTNSREWRRT